MRANLVVFFQPELDDTPCFRHGIEQPSIQTAVPKYCIETFIGPVLPGTARVNVMGAHLLVSQPVLQDPGDQFRSDRDIEFLYRVLPDIDDVMFICRDRESRQCRKFVTLEVNGVGESVSGYGFTAFEVKITNSLPAGIAYQHYFSLADIDGCIGDGPFNQWTDTNSIEVRYNGEDMVRQTWGDSSIDGECEVSMQFKTTDNGLTFKPAAEWGRYSDTPGRVKLEFSLYRGEVIYWDRL